MAPRTTSRGGTGGRTETGVRCTNTGTVYNARAFRRGVTNSRRFFFQDRWPAGARADVAWSRNRGRDRIEPGRERARNDRGEFSASATRLKPPRDRRPFGASVLRSMTVAYGRRRHLHYLGGAPPNTDAGNACHLCLHRENIIINNMVGQPCFVYLRFR